MVGILGRTRALAASLVLASAAIAGTPASAQWTEPPACEDLEPQCAANYQAWGYSSYADCYRHLLCYACWGGYLCGADPGGWGATKPDLGKPW